MTEFWKPVPGWEDRYLVSDAGRVKSLCHRGKPRKVAALLSPAESSTGYHSVTFCRDGVMTRKMVHRLVLEAFTGPCPDKHECGHLNGNPRHNYLANLKWITRKENAEHRDKHGQTSRGEDRPLSVFTESEVRAMRMMMGCGFRKSKLVNLVVEHKGCDPTVVRDILAFRTWRHVQTWTSA